MPEVEGKLQDIPQQGNLDITTALVKKAAKSMKSWKLPGKDKIQGYWIKTLNNLHDRLAWQLQSVVVGNIPEWISQGWISLIMKKQRHWTKSGN